MNQDFAVQVLYQGVTLTLLLSLPAVGVGLLVGFIISLFQAVTQIQEQTLTFVPKVVSVFLIIAFTSPWIFSMIIDFTNSLWANIPAMVR
ncbi:EscS/YscS/HrcS family type III secretion system export apparatus protein [candidate division WOR-1 bacterium RIFOXYA12_FULL_43_27]|uniref:Flagellar biosynthetic protein FliQ n=1 Tax=candidate division WOR-1 bacterium RIFOXYC2_FULL_46_14 TaxID=1802587 RepID=A0A1F4U7Q9_UNCSA|nr:MAG: EscS/YscS/HrcS family type III secretion system export apparatus protein [candidate division WOR-1 bacterium RIFOXYA12_FULL_43_27]OGC19342.1 MAG: EscS/YscS/HrcS family type III secretion system export apparatus protein [candidate division WOR-1 bacterium RIFOXYB2_FULL_46_45]OGC30331.1 MAG: EscS/YscS/HrcS family type III secretion system export apparatus protein [candidate division WOR-1 bacterium RIFOXYA2_FULL_46_56]OGC40932.1 MAG: EscS/YscS/HrcS family type III secretion system export a